MPPPTHRRVCMDRGQGPDPCTHRPLETPACARRERCEASRSAAWSRACRPRPGGLTPAPGPGVRPVRAHQPRAGPEAGIGSEAIRWAVASGRWTAVHPGVYLTTTGPGRLGGPGRRRPALRRGAQPHSPDRVQPWPWGLEPARTGVGPPHRPGRPAGRAPATASSHAVETLRRARSTTGHGRTGPPSSTPFSTSACAHPWIGCWPSRSRVPTAPHGRGPTRGGARGPHRTRRTAPCSGSASPTWARRRERRRGALHPRRRARHGLPIALRQAHRVRPSLRQPLRGRAGRARGGREARARGVGRTGPRRPRDRRLGAAGTGPVECAGRVASLAGGLASRGRDLQRAGVAWPVRPCRRRGCSSPGCRLAAALRAVCTVRPQGAPNWCTRPRGPRRGQAS